MQEQTNAYEHLSEVSEILDSMDTERVFISPTEHKSKLIDRRLAYDELLDLAAQYMSWCELIEYENEGLEKLLNAAEILQIASQDIRERSITAHKELGEITEALALCVATKRYAEGAIAGREAWKKGLAKKGANAVHDKPGGSREKQDAIRAIWATGKYSNRDRCAEEECAALGMSFSTARKALRNTPDPM